LGLWAGKTRGDEPQSAPTPPPTQDEPAAQAVDPTALFDAAINDRPASFMADTGATLVVLTYEDAARLGLSPHSLDFSGYAETANGVSRVAPVMLDRVSIGDITVRNVPAAVSEPGKLGTSLLGMSFLGRLQQIDIRSGVLVLKE
jgi:aspartyl protease family protein